MRNVGLKVKRKRLILELKERSFRIFWRAKMKNIERRIGIMVRKSEITAGHTCFFCSRTFLEYKKITIIISKRKRNVRKISAGDFVRLAIERKLACEGENKEIDFIFSN